MTARTAEKTAQRPPRAWHSIPEYQALRALLQSGSTTAAAHQLDVSQSAVSRSISSLEARLATTLFERSGGRLQPTQEAYRLNKRLDPLFEALDQIEGPSEPAQEILRVATSPSYSRQFMTTHAAGFMQANANARMTLDMTTSDEVTRGILEGRFDLGISGIEQSRVGLKQIPFRRAKPVCVLPRGHPLADKPQIRPEDLEAQDFVALIYRHARRGQLDRLLRQCNARPRIKAEVSSGFAAVDLVREGIGITIINPFPLYHDRSDDIVYRPFVSPIRYRVYFLLPENAPVTRSAAAFMRHVRLNTPADPFSEPERADGKRTQTGQGDLS